MSTPSNAVPVQTLRTPIPVEADIVIAGGGTVACIVAGRLAAADPSLSIVVLEAGPPTLNDNLHVQPARYLYHLNPASKTVRFMVSNPSPAMNGRQSVVPCGQCLGGGSSVNFCMYTRPAASDYEDWKRVYGNEGWGQDDLIPMLKKAETYQVAEKGQDAERDQVHGYNGPLKISYGGIFTNIGRDFLDVAKGYDKTRGTTDDPNNLHKVDLYGRWQKFIDANTGKRSDIAHHYIYNQLNQLDNLRVITGVHVRRVLFSGTKATGVEYNYNPNFHPEESSDVHTIRAKKLVLVSAGAFGSPAILERSGIGRKDVLDKCGITPLVELNGVGENYQDHQVIFPPYLASAESDTLDAIIRGDEEVIKETSELWEKEGKGLMAHNALDAGVKLRFSPEELKAIGPRFTKRYEEYYQNAPDKPAGWIGTVSMLVGDPSSVPPAKYFAVGYYVQHPVSIGSVHITSTDVLAAPSFHPGYLDQEEDLELLKYLYKRSREFARRMPAYRGEVVGAHPKFSEKSQAKVSGDAQPVPINAPDLVYSEEDEKAIETFTRDFVATAWHSLGTCAMKPRESGGVVDNRLNVYGTTGLKVADMSICPSNVSANTYSTAVAIGERAAILIAEELGVKGV